MIKSFELVLIGCLVFLSAFLAASEVALFSLSRFQLRYLKEHFKPIYIQIKKLLSDPSGLLVTILVTNEVVNISVATTIQKIVLRNWSEMDQDSGLWWVKTHFASTPVWLLQMAVGVVLTTPIVLIICEMTPKVLAARANQVIAPLTTTSLLWLHTLLTPLRILISKFVGFLLGKRLRKKTELLNSGFKGTLIKEDEFLFMIEEGHREGIVHSSELELIRNIFELDETKADEICTPLSKLYALPISATIRQSLEAYRSKPFSRIPIYRDDRNSIVGILFSKDLIPARLDPTLQTQSVETLMRKPLFVKQGMRLNVLFRTMRQNHTHMVVILSPTDKVVGVVTMSDLLAEVFGEFFEGGTQPVGGKL